MIRRFNRQDTLSIEVFDYFVITVINQDCWREYLINFVKQEADTKKV